MLTDAQAVELSMAAMERNRQRRALLFANGPRFNVILYAAKDLSHLETLLSRLPASVRERKQVTVDEYFDMLATPASESDPKELLVIASLVQSAGFDRIQHIPSSMIFLCYSVITEKNGHFQELRDQTSCKWGDFDKKILTDHVLNPRDARETL